ncbi:MAG TPA: hypothetical protein VIR03_01815 [Candidatus Saccharimonadales bacterium]
MTAVIERLETAAGQPGNYELSEVTDVIDVQPATIGIDPTNKPGEIVMVSVADPYVADLQRRSPERFKQIRGQERAMNAFAGARHRAEKWLRDPRTPYVDEMGVLQEGKTKRDSGDPVSQRRFCEPAMPGSTDPLDGVISDPSITAWRAMVPAAGALLPLTNPTNTHVLHEGTKDEITVPKATQDWWVACTDARGIRNRGAVLATEVVDALDDREERRPGEPITMISVGAGTLLPALQAAVSSGKDSNVRIVMIEQDPRSIAMAHQLASELGFKGEIIVKAIDVFDPEAMEGLVAELEGIATTVDAVGLFEYINENATELKRMKGKDYLLFKPVEFMKLINRLVEPGGRLIVGQMREDRPRPDFTMGVIGWPYVVMRSPNELLRIAREAGLDLANMRLTLTPEGVYSMLSHVKPLEGNAAAANTSGSRTVVSGKVAGPLGTLAVIN